MAAKKKTVKKTAKKTTKKTVSKKPAVKSKKPVAKKAPKAPKKSAKKNGPYPFATGARLDQPTDQPIFDWAEPTDDLPVSPNPPTGGCC